MRSFSYAFEELPLVISGGYAACDVTGFAEITYDMTGAWSVQRIGFDGWIIPGGKISSGTWLTSCLRRQNCFESA